MEDKEETLVTLFRQFLVALKAWILSFIGSTPKPVEPEVPVKPDPPVVVKDPCPEGPLIKKITVLNDRLIDVLFHGRDIFWAQIIIKNPEGNVINNTTAFENHSNTPRIGLNEPLRDAVYTIIYNAISCSGSDAKTFNGRTGAFISENPPQPSVCPDPVTINKINIS